MQVELEEGGCVHFGDVSTDLPVYASAIDAKTLRSDY